MIRSFFLFIIFIHGLVHLLGFVKAFGFAEIKELSIPVSIQQGVMWLAVFTLFLITGLLNIWKNEYWWALAFVAVILSQILIFYFWQDAKFGSIANAVILLGAVVGLATWNFENAYHIDVRNALDQTSLVNNEIIEEIDLKHLPEPVQNYLRYVGVIGKPKIKYVRITFNGKMREKGKDWFPFTSEQHNFFGEPERLFFMKANFKGFPTDGYHRYKDGKANMLIKVLSLFPVVDIQGIEQAEAVTFLNDMCLFAPGALIGQQIQWEETGHLSSKAIFTHKGITISAILYFNEQGQLIDFTSDDRMDISDGKKYTFSTPARNYKEINGQRLCSYGEAIWHYPEVKFVYGEFNLESVETNIES